MSRWETSIKTESWGQKWSLQRAEPIGNKTSSSHLARAQPTENPVYFKLFISLMDSVYYNPANFLFYKGLSPGCRDPHGLPRPAPGPIPPAPLSCWFWINLFFCWKTNWQSTCFRSTQDTAESGDGWIMENAYGVEFGPRSEIMWMWINNLSCINLSFLPEKETIWEWEHYLNDLMK